MEEVMTMEEIEKRFDSEWVLLADPEVNEQFEIVGGRVVFHSPDRDEVDRKAIELKLKSFASLYTGKIPEDMAFVI